MNEFYLFKFWVCILLIKKKKKKKKKKDFIKQSITQNEYIIFINILYSVILINE